MGERQLLEHPGHLFIDGRWVDPSTRGTFAVVNSATEEPFLTVAEAVEDDIEVAVSAARRAFDHGPWPRLSHVERARYMYALADEFDKRLEKLAEIWTAESGILHKQAKAFSPGFTADMRATAALAETFPFEEEHPAKSGGKHALLVREPVGVVAAIVPWNAPAAAIKSKIAPALLAGCTIIFKSSPEAPGTAYLLAEACEAAGLPAGVLNILTADRDASESLVRNPGVDKVAFTGSTSAGRRIASICGDRIARVTLELGGKSPAVILDDYDIATAAKTITDRAVFLTGQICQSLTRIIVPRARHDALTEALADNFSKVKVGDPFDDTSDMGPLASAAQLGRVEDLIAKAQAEGARLAAGGGRPSGLNRGYFIEPTVFGDVKNDSTIGRDEVFGPVLSVIAADSEEHAVALANDTIYGLNASVFTTDVERAYSIARTLRSGTVGHNALRTEAMLSFGGFKQSGVGREGGAEGLRAYLENKVVILDGLPAKLKR